MSEPIIRFTDFSFQYDAQSEPTLYDINLTVSRGERILIAGPSGCGKSTLLNCINGLVPFSMGGTITGSLTVQAKETRDMSIAALSSVVGTVLQDSDAQFIGMTVKEDIAFALENEEMLQPEMKERVERAAKIVGMSDFLRHAPTELSGGQKQRVSMAGILVDDVEVMLFDEPLANLDPATGKTAMELIEAVADKTGAAVVIVEHRLEDVLHRDVDRIVLMNEGRIIFDGTPDALLSTGLLTENGIREPLYLTALKYAGVFVTEEKKPRSMRTLQLTDADKEKVRAWYKATVPAPVKPLDDVFLSLRDVTFSYGENPPTLKGVNLELHKGELAALVGRNGAGKSTLAKAVCRFEKISGGTMTLCGEDLTELSIKECADRVGYVMQNPNKMISKTMIFDEVALGLRMRGIEENAVKKRVEKALRICGLYEFRNWPISALSYGQKKRVTIASILVLEPEMIILDEPTAGQDYYHYTEIMEFLRELNESGLTILMITHDMHLMLEYADRSVVFSGGKVIADKSSAEVLTDPDIVKEASLKETSLYDLALVCGIESPSDFARHFIDYDREVRNRG